MDIIKYYLNKEDNSLIKVNFNDSQIHISHSGEQWDCIGADKMMSYSISKDSNMHPISKRMAELAIKIKAK